MLLVLVTGVWMGHMVNKARRQREAVAAVKAYGGWVHYDWEFVNGKLAAGNKPHAPGWLRRLIGDDFFQEIAQVSLVYDDSTGKRYDIENLEPADDVLARLEGQTGIRFLLLQKTQATDAGLKSIRNLTNLEGLYIWDATEITDEGIAHLKRLTKLKAFDVARSKMTDKGLETLSGCTGMEHLSIEGTQVTDGGLAHLKEMKNLSVLSIGESLDISDGCVRHCLHLKRLRYLALRLSNVTDRGLEQLKGLPSLRLLNVQDTRISEKGVKTFQQSVPGVRIIH